MLPILGKYKIFIGRYETVEVFMVKVSIVVPVYNTPEKYLEKCIKSICNQTIEELELILVDDGSEKACADLLDRFQEEDERIKVVHIENQGVSNARNIGIEQSVGEWITFVDSDDWIEAETLERLLNLSEKSGADILMWRFDKEIGDSYENTPFLGKDYMVFQGNEIQKLQRMLLNFYSYSDEMLFTFLVTTVCKMYKTEIIKENQISFPVNVKNGEDGIFAIEAFQYAKKVVFTNQILYHYVQRENSVSKAFRPETIESWRNNRKETKKLLERLGIMEHMQDVYDYHAVEVLKLILFTVYAHKDYKKTEGLLSIKELLHTPEFGPSIKRIPLKNIYGSKGKIVAFCAKHNMTGVLVWLTKIRSKMI